MLRATRVTRRRPTLLLGILRKSARSGRRGGFPARGADSPGRRDHGRGGLGQDRSRVQGTQHRASYPAQRVQVQAVGYPDGDYGTSDTEGEGGELLPEPAGAAETKRACPAGRHPASIRGGGVDEASGRPGKGVGCEGISKSQVSRICSELDEVVDSFLGRPLDEGLYRYVWLDAVTQKVRESGRIVNVSVVVATAVNAEGKREIVGMDVGTSEDGAFWLQFLRPVADRCLSGVELVISDAHRGLRDAIATVFAGATWQRCRTHFMTNLLTRVPRRAQPAAGGGYDGQDRLPAAVGRGVACPAAQGDRPARGPVPSGRLDAGRGRSGRAGLHGVPCASLETDLVEQPAGTVKQGDTQTDGCGGGLPEPAGSAPARGSGAGRAA